MDFATVLCKLTYSFPATEKYGLAAHCRKTALSVVSNIAEGASRESVKERRRFYIIARSSLVELDTQLELAKRLNFMSEENLAIIDDFILRIFKMLSVLIRKTQ